jgi:hypothetical protein
MTTISAPKLSSWRSTHRPVAAKGGAPRCSHTPEDTDRRRPRGARCAVRRSWTSAPMLGKSTWIGDRSTCFCPRSTTRAHDRRTATTRQPRKISGPTRAVGTGADRPGRPAVLQTAGGATPAPKPASHPRGRSGIPQAASSLPLSNAGTTASGHGHTARRCSRSAPPIAKSAADTSTPQWCATRIPSWRRGRSAGSRMTTASVSRPNRGVVGHQIAHN